MLYAINILVISLLVSVIALLVDYLINTTTRFICIAIVGIFFVILCIEIIQVSQHYSIGGIVSVFYNFLHVPLILFASFCYIISGALYAHEVLKKSSRKASPESIQKVIDEQKNP